MSFSYGADTLQPAFDDRAVPYIAYGARFPQAVHDLVHQTLDAHRIYIIASKSLSTQTNALQRLQKSLGSHVVGTRIGISPHTPASEILAIAQEALPLNPDCIVTLGAGSITDGSKVIAWMLANEVTTTEDLWKMSSASPDRRTDWKDPVIRVISIPTSLSGGEYQSIAGVTNEEMHQKRLFEPPVRNPSVVVLDPELTTTTPERIWLSTGVRAIDHCVETLCSLLSNDSGDAAAERGLGKLIPALLRCKRDTQDLDARFEAMMGVIDAMNAVGNGVPLGASHAIGHQLGPLGVRHGETSCIMLPAVCKWNKKEGANVERQNKCVEILMKDEEVEKLMAAKGTESDLGDILDAIFRELGMPRTLKDVGVGRDKLDMLAKNSLEDHWIKTNAKPIIETSQVMEILEMVVE